MKLLKRTLWLIPVLAATLLTTACSDLLSVEPLATDSNTIFDPGLLGVWICSDGEKITCIVSIQEGENHTYDIVWIDIKSDWTNIKIDEKYRLAGRLVQIEGQHILDVTPHNGEAGAFYVPGHAFVYLSALPNGLQIQFLDSKWLQEQVQQNRSLSHYELEDHPIITGTTAQVQNFFSQFGLNERARSESVSLQRLK